MAGKGFIGSETGKVLEDESHEVKYLDREKADFEYDITSDFKIDEEFDVLIHTIGLAPGFYSAEKYRKLHVEGTRNLIQSVDADKIVFLSALGAGEVDHSFFRTKLEAEELVKDSGSDYVILRPSTVYGEGNKLLETIKKMAFTRVFPDIRTKTQPIHREDLVEIVSAAIEGYRDQILNIAGKEEISIGEMARNIYNEEGYSCFLIPYPQFLLEWKLVGLSFLPPPFQKENLQILRNDNTTDRNDAEDIVELRSFL
ncbi:MAG: NAD-dependent epimerase/dehydratase family protein [Candidatus Nanohaloarchaea archaeon]